MKRHKYKGMPTSLLIAGALVLGSHAGRVPALAQAAPVATAPYKISAFAKGPAGVSQPDFMALWNDNVIVGFQNHVAKDGTDGKFSTIVEFSLAGKVKRSFQVQGHNDGLRVVGDNQLWAVQNEDANPNLVVIDLKTGQAKKYKFASDPHGGGYAGIVLK